MIDKERIVSEGDIAKYKVEITHQDFDQHRDNYKVVLSYGMFKQSVTIEKDDMLVDEDGNIFMAFDTTGMVGLVKATCIYDVEDSDTESGTRQEVNYQWLCFVTKNPDPHLCGDFIPGGDGHVVYTRVYAADVHTVYLNLRDSEKKNLLDSDGKQLRVHKTDEEMHDYYEDK